MCGVNRPHSYSSKARCGERAVICSVYDRQNAPNIADFKELHSLHQVLYSSKRPQWNYAFMITRH